MIYSYNVTTDISAGKVNLDRLLLDIQEVIPSVDIINKNDNIIDIKFMTSLSSNEEDQLTSIVLAHSGEPIPEETVPVLDIEDDGRQVVRTAATRKGWHYQAHSVEFEVCKPGYVYNKDDVGNDLGFTECKVYKSDGSECSDQTDADVNGVKTVVTWKPNFDFEIISGNIRQATKESDNTYIYVNAKVPTGHPAPYDWLKVPFTQGGINMKYIGADETLKTDGRASKLINGASGSHFEIIANHDPGNHHEMSIIFEIYKDPMS